MSQRPFILGLTGSIGMGKSTVARMFEDCGVPVFDADAEVRRLQGPMGALLPDIEAAFPVFTGAQGVLREKLGEQVFADADALARLEAIVHPAILAVRNDFLANHSGERIIVFDVPLLYEKGTGTGLDAIAVVSASADQQRQRVLGRPGMTVEKFEDILGLQMPDEEKRARADYVINTGGPLERTRDQVEALIASLESRL